MSVGTEICRQISTICRRRNTGPIAIDCKEELRTGRICAQVIYTHNQPVSDKQRFSLHQRWYKNCSAKACEGHVLLVEVTKEFFAAHENAIFVLKASGLHVGPDGEVVN